MPPPNSIARLPRIKRFRSSKSLPVSIPNQLLWASIGLLLTINGTFIKVFFTNFPWDWLERGISFQFVGVNYQIGAVLLASCLGGKNAGAIAQIAYIFVGLTLLPVFDRGGGIAYLQEANFGYLLGFVAGAWLCGWLAFRHKPQLESLSLSCICGLLAIHLTGTIYTIGLSYFLRASQELNPIQSMVEYSIYPLPGQLVVVCAVAVIAFIVRRILFY